MKLYNPTTSLQDSSIITSPTIIARARLLTLLGYYTITTAKATPFISYGIYIVPLPLAVIFRGIYTSTLSQLTHPINNCFPTLAMNGICIRSHINSYCAFLLVLFTNILTTNPLVNLESKCKVITISYLIGRAYREYTILV